MDALYGLTQRQINWREVKPNSSEFEATIDGRRYELRMNDFPDEPLYTLRGEEGAIDIDDAPGCWTIPPLDDSS